MELLSVKPLTIQMQDYGGFEKVGSLGRTLPRNDEQINTTAGDLILYQGNRFVIYYSTNSWNFTRLGRIDKATAGELKAALGDGDVSVTLSVANAVSSKMPEDLIFVQGGTFTMGSPAEELDRISDEIQHSVAVSGFYLAKSEVTQKEYRELRGGNPGEHSGDDLPVESVTWFDAVRFCNARSEKEGLTPAYVINGESVTWNRAANGYRLPTEAEWEYACRAGTTTPFNTGRTITDKEANINNSYGYNKDASGRVIGGYRQKIIAVNSFSPNPWGLFDMHGNVGEWCWDWYGDYNASERIDPAGAVSGVYRVVRGGGWNDFPKHARSAYRAATPPNEGMYNIGFRVARNEK
jgi:formylglycine-generating enzyme required for sulfatase activity